ncbi:MAG: threonine--tRNA ligase [Candidatus Nomurabacteria bacterium]|jgi:threonyl-tRNA synthetase|nr:threonine--tRNA ligase [Candidatus Nomurabacteria bacterium]
MEKKLETMRHSMAHIMAAAVARLYGDVKFGVGPAVDDGFYYDIDFGEQTISDTDLPKIEKEIRKIIGQKLEFTRSEMPIDEAIDWAKKSGQVYKQELLEDLKTKGTTSVKEEDLGDSVSEATFYTVGDFTDLCRGPHLTNTGEAGVFKLTRVSGAYWRGDEKRPQMQRIYGVAFETDEQLQDYLTRQEEAKKRDHRRLGKELDLFTFSDLVGAGLPLYTPRGTVIIRELKKVLEEIGQKYNMQQVSIPHLAKIELYETSGHAEKFADELFRVASHYNQEFVLKPVNCPHHTQIYASQPRSYRDLPLRYVEQTMQYRDEKPGQIGGLQRTRGFTVDDGHTFCRIDQVKQEVSIIIEIIQNFYKSLGLWDEKWVSLSLRDYTKPEKYIGDTGDWEQAESMLGEIANEYKLDAKRMEGEAALYGPKIDFMFKDSLGRDTQLATVQLDFAMPKRFSLAYTDQDGSEQTPVMIHRAIFGSFERFIMLLIEHFNGKFPVWLSPEQLRIIKVKDLPEVDKFIADMMTLVDKKGVRATLDDSNNSVGKKIRNAEIYRVPYVVVIGEKEVESGKLPVRIRSDIVVKNTTVDCSPEELIKTVVKETTKRVNKTTL